MPEKIFIKNRKDEKVAVLLELQPQPAGLAFIMHGLGGVKEQPQLETIAGVFTANNYSVVRFDTTNTFGESAGRYEAATPTNYYEDLVDVITWAEGQSWCQKPFILVGHSTGAFCVAWYAENHPELVKGLAPLATVVSGKLLLESPKVKQHIEGWQKTGWREETSSDGKRLKRLPWGYMEDWLKYDLLKQVDQLRMPTLLIVGDQDSSTPPDQQKLLFEQLPGRKELHIVKNTKHTFREPESLVEIRSIFEKWIPTV